MSTLTTSQSGSLFATPVLITDKSGIESMLSRHANLANQPLRAVVGSQRYSLFALVGKLPNGNYVFLAQAGDNLESRASGVQLFVVGTNHSELENLGTIGIDSITTHDGQLSLGPEATLVATLFSPTDFRIALEQLGEGTLGSDSNLIHLLAGNVSDIVVDSKTTYNVVKILGQGGRGVVYWVKQGRVVDGQEVVEEFAVKVHHATSSGEYSPVAAAYHESVAHRLAIERLGTGNIVGAYPGELPEGTFLSPSGQVLYRASAFPVRLLLGTTLSSLDLPAMLPQSQRELLLDLFKQAAKLTDNAIRVGVANPDAVGRNMYVTTNTEEGETTLTVIDLGELHLVDYSPLVVREVLLELNDQILIREFLSQLAELRPRPAGIFQLFDSLPFSEVWNELNKTIGSEALLKVDIPNDLVSDKLRKKALVNALFAQDPNPLKPYLDLFDKLDSILALLKNDSTYESGLAAFKRLDLSLLSPARGFDAWLSNHLKQIDTPIDWDRVLKNVAGEKLLTPPGGLVSIPEIPNPAIIFRDENLPPSFDLVAAVNVYSLVAGLFQKLTGHMHIPVISQSGGYDLLPLSELNSLAIGQIVSSLGYYYHGSATENGYPPNIQLEGLLRAAQSGPLSGVDTSKLARMLELFNSFFSQYYGYYATKARDPLAIAPKLQAGDFINKLSTILLPDEDETSEAPVVTSSSVPITYAEV